MNIRFASEDIRFRISEEELQQLQVGQILETSLTIAGKVLRFTIDPRDTEKPMDLSYQEDRVCLIISPETVESLINMGRSKEGIIREQDGFTVALQLDVRSQKRCVA